MSTRAKPTSVTVETDWRQLLDAAAVGPVLVEHDGVVYRLSRDVDVDESQRTSDSERVGEALRRFAGTFTPEEGDNLKALIRQARDDGDRSRTRP